MTQVAEDAGPAVREHVVEAASGAPIQTAQQLLVLGRRMSRIAMRLAAARADELDLTMPQHQALRALRHRSCRMTDLGGRLMVSKQWASQSVDSLVRAGLATRHEDPDDRRHAVVSATPQGLERLGEPRAGDRHVSWPGRWKGCPLRRLRVSMRHWRR